MRRGQGAVEYIIILGVIILIALIVVASLGGLGIFNFSTTAQTRSTEISNLLSNVAFTYVLDDTGAVQVSIKSTTYKRITAHNMTWYNSSGTPVCYVLMTDTVIRQNFDTFGNSSCTDLAGTAGIAYDFDCTLKYKDANNIEHSVKGTCEGSYEEA